MPRHLNRPGKVQCDTMHGRIWDRFLTHRDRTGWAVLDSPRQVFGERPALLLIDLYRWVYRDVPEPIEQARQSWPGTCGLAAWDAIVPIQSLLATTRQLQLPIIHTTGDVAGRAARPLVDVLEYLERFGRAATRALEARDAVA